MAFILGDVTLPYPKSFNRKFVEVARSNTNINGKTRKQILNRKEQFTLTYQNLTKEKADSILSEYELEEVRTFEVTDANLTISATDVLIDVKERVYPPTGVHYRSDITITLTEVS